MQPRHKFTAKDREKSAGVRREGSKNITFAEMKRLISDRLRDPHTDARSFVKLLVIYVSRFSKLVKGKGAIQAAVGPESEESVEQLVQQLEAEARKAPQSESEILKFRREAT